MCSEPINGEPFADLTAAWAAGFEAQTLCSADCALSVLQQWRDYIDQQYNSDKPQR